MIGINASLFACWRVFSMTRERLWHVEEWVGTFVRADCPGASVQPSLWSFSGSHSCFFSLWVSVTTWGPWVGMEWWFFSSQGTHSPLSFSQLWKLPCLHLFLSFSLVPQEPHSITFLLGLTSKSKTNKTKRNITKLKSPYVSSGSFYFSTCNVSRY